MWKLIAGVFLFLISYGIGWLMCGRLSYEFNMLSGISADLKTMHSAVKYERKSLLELTTMLADRGELTEFWHEMSIRLEADCGVMAAWGFASKLLKGLNEKDMDTIDAFFMNFGKGGAETELGRFELVLESIGESQGKLKAEYSDRIKLIKTLSVLSGIAFALLIL